MSEQHGIDISQLRLDDLDKQILHFALDYKAGDKVAVDLGCGFGRVSIMLALAGFEVWLFDKRDLREHFTKISEALTMEGKLKFFQKDITKITKEDLPKKYSITIAQRVLHHLPFMNAQILIEIIGENVGREGKVFTSFSGLTSEIGQNYKHGGNTIEDRYCKISKENQEKFGISDSICLYNEEDVKKLFSNTNLRQQELYTSSFGNIKAIYVL